MNSWPDCVLLVGTHLARPISLCSGLAPGSGFERPDGKLNGQEVRLTATEYSLLHFFVQHAGKVLTHQQILREVWEPNQVDQTHYLRVYIAHLRDKLEADSAQPELIITEPAVGYRLIEKEPTVLCTPTKTL